MSGSVFVQHKLLIASKRGKMYGGQGRAGNNAWCFAISPDQTALWKAERWQLLLRPVSQLSCARKAGTELQLFQYLQE